MIEKTMAHKIADKELALAGTFTFIEVSIEKRELAIDNYYSQQMKIFEEIELPDNFTPKLIIEKIRGHEKEDPDIFAHTQKIATIQWELGRYRSLVMRDITSNIHYKELPEHLWRYLESLKTFYEFINSNIDEKRDSILPLLFGTDIPFEYIDLSDLSYLLENISLKAIIKTVQKTQDEIVALIHRNIVGNIPLKTFFRFAVKRGGKKRVTKIVGKNSQKIHQIFKKTGAMEHARVKCIWFIRVWNAKSIDDLPYLGSLTMKKVDEKKFFEYFKEFEEKYYECNNFLLNNFYDVFSDVNLIRDEIVQKTWNEMADALIT